jgi:hypothetical protein
VRVVSGTNAQLMTQLRQGEIDLVLGRLAQASAMADLAFEHLYSEPLRLVVRPGHPLASRRKPTLDALAAYPLVLPVSGTLIRHTADAFLIAQGMALPNQLVEATDTSFVVGLLQRSEAVWFAPQGAVEGLLARGELKRVAIDTDEHRRAGGAHGAAHRRCGRRHRAQGNGRGRAPADRGNPRHREQAQGLSTAPMPALEVRACAQPASLGFGYSQPTSTRPLSLLATIHAPLPPLPSLPASRARPRPSTARRPSWRATASRSVAVGHGVRRVVAQLVAAEAHVLHLKARHGDRLGHVPHVGHEGAEFRALGPAASVPSSSLSA